MYHKVKPWVLELGSLKDGTHLSAEDLGRILEAAREVDPNAKIVTSRMLGTVIYCYNEDAAFNAKMFAPHSRILQRG